MCHRCHSIFSTPYVLLNPNNILFPLRAKNKKNVMTVMTKRGFWSFFWLGGVFPFFFGLLKKRVRQNEH